MYSILKILIHYQKFAQLNTGNKHFFDTLLDTFLHEFLTYYAKVRLFFNLFLKAIFQLVSAKLHLFVARINELMLRLHDFLLQN